MFLDLCFAPESQRLRAYVFDHMILVTVVILTLYAQVSMRAVTAFATFCPPYGVIDDVSPKPTGCQQEVDDTQLVTLAYKV